MNTHGIGKKMLIDNLYVFGVHLMSLGVGLIRSLLLPVMVGISDFGYWQVYVLYSTYYGLLTFGFNDGVYLKYGRTDYDHFPRPLFRATMRIFILFLVFWVIVGGGLLRFETDPAKRLAFSFSLLNVVVLGITGTFSYVLQVSNQLKKYSFYLAMDKVLTILLFGMLILVGTKNFHAYVLSDFLIKSAVMLSLAYACRDLLLGETKGLLEGWKGFKDNLAVGSKLMVATLSDLLLVGLGRILLERFLHVAEFALFSFAMSSTLLIMLFVYAFSSVLYPSLARLNQDKHPESFVRLNRLVMLAVLILLIFFFPLKLFILFVLPQYIGVLGYLPLLFGVVFFQACIQIVYNTFLKTLRMEKKLLQINLVSLLLYMLWLIPAFYLKQSIMLVVLSTLAAQFFKAIYLYVVVSRRILGENGKLNFSDWGWIVVFMACAFFEPLLGGGLYSICLVLILYIHRDDVSFLKRVLSISVSAGRIGS